MVIAAATATTKSSYCIKWYTQERRKNKYKITNKTTLRFTEFKAVH